MQELFDRVLGLGGGTMADETSFLLAKGATLLELTPAQLEAVEKAFDKIARGKAHGVRAFTKSGNRLMPFGLTSRPAAASVASQLGTAFSLGGAFLSGFQEVESQQIPGANNTTAAGRTSSVIVITLLSGTSALPAAESSLFLRGAGPAVTTAAAASAAVDVVFVVLDPAHAPPQIFDGTLLTGGRFIVATAESVFTGSTQPIKNLSRRVSSAESGGFSQVFSGLGKHSTEGAFFVFSGGELTPEFVAEHEQQRQEFRTAMRRGVYGLFGQVVYWTTPMGWLLIGEDVARGTGSYLTGE